MDREVKNVFDHNAQPETVEQLRAAVVHDVHWLRNSCPNFDKVTAADLDPEVYKDLKEKYRPLLHFGVFSFPAKRALVNELIWKWTEATGKYVGCQFWSARAKALIDRDVESSGGWPIPEKLAKAIEKKLAAKSADGKPKLSNARLTHEHVYPIKDMKIVFAERPGRLLKEFGSCSISNALAV